MASTKKQDKSTPVPEQAGTNLTDQTLNSPHIGADAATADPTAGVTVTTPTSVNDAPEAGGTATGLAVELEPAVISTGDAGNAGVSTIQPGQGGDALHFAADAAGLNDLTSSPIVEVNPAKVKVYPLRSFMDEGELRRRHGPGYLVPRRHAEELELRKLVSRTPLEK
uniref:hypothetical protein n=1 Tax=Pseudomonas fulva TaxID=47880 RepID=UPI001F4630CF|nr:hypothetical protein [Pseudomonas fulva]